MVDEAPSAPAAPNATDDPSATLGRYRLLQKIARGGMAEVFLARSYGAHGFEKTVAIKRILKRYGRDPQFVRMLVDEAKISVLLNHPNIAQVLELGEHEGDHFIVMEFVPGHSLATLVKRMREAGARTDPLDAAFILVEMLQGLHAAHIQREPTGRPANIIHRDVSPQNVLVSRDGHVKLIDFGIARAKDRLEATEVGTIKGKLRYLAPEMIDPQRFSASGDFDHRVDVFAAGICLYELLSGRSLFTGVNEVAVYEAITQHDVPDLFTQGMADETLSAIAQRALERYPDRRYPTAEAFADDLRAYLYRNDPAYTHKRIGALVERYFATELRDLERMEQSPPEAAEPGKEVVLTRTHTPRDLGSRSSRSSRSGSSRSSRSGRASDAPAAELGARETQRVSAPSPLAIGVADPTRAVRPTSAVERSDPRPSARSSDGPTQALDRGDTPATLAGSAVSDAEALASQAAALRRPRDDSTGVIARRRDGGARRALYAISGLLGIGLSLGIVVVLEIQRRAEPVNRATTIARPAPRDDVRLLVNARPEGARVRRVDVLGDPMASPALFSVRAGTEVDVEIIAAGHEPRRQRIAIPTDEDTVRVDVSLEPSLVMLEVRTSPERATVRVDGAPYSATSMVRPGVPVVIEATAPGHEPMKKEVTAEVGAPLVVSLELRSTAAREVPSTGKAILFVTSAPYWGRIAVDGKIIEETTPSRLELKAGAHEIVVSHPPKGLERRFRITLKPGETARRAITF